MSQKKQAKPVQKVTAQAINATGQRATPPAAFNIRYAWLWLALAAVATYIISFRFGYTDLDDTIFIKDFQNYNEDLHNLVGAFGRGLFDAVKDPYYRPLFSDSIILNYQVSGVEITSYHVINVLLHTTAVVLLYQLFRKLELKEVTAFILALVFAVHPVLSQAVAWVPGRNDVLLAIFTISFFLCAISYSSDAAIPKPLSFIFSGFFLLLAFFTKETAVFAPPAAFILIVFVLRMPWRGARSMALYAAWVACFLVWFTARYQATISGTGIATGRGLTETVRRLPVAIQYLGKIFFPFNLSVFPTQQDTTYYFGIAAVILLAIIILLYPARNMRIILSGLGVFLLFLMPALLVPDNLNQQTFEHRLYLPIIGILLILPQTILFHNRLGNKQLVVAAIGVCGVLAGINIYHQESFANPRSFWTQAAETSPNSAYANMMLAARLDTNEFARSEQLFRKAYQLNPREKYLNFYMGELLQKKDSVAASEKYLLAEKSGSDYYQCDFLLARVAMERKDFNGAINYLETYLKRDPRNGMANNNLLLLYLQTQQPDKAKAHIRDMQRYGIPVPAGLVHQLGM